VEFLRPASLAAALAAKAATPGAVPLAGGAVRNACRAVADAVYARLGVSSAGMSLAGGKVVQLDCAQDVGKAMNPDAVVAQIQGGSAQGLGLAVMEEIQVVAGKVRNPSFTDYLIPTTLDTPPMRVEVLERPDPHAPYGVRGVGEPPTISATPAIANAATGV
jgi:xanthine dehydrogenase molybdopterin-binding subunit B